MSYKGVANGRIIELEEPLPYTEGQRVSVLIEPLRAEIEPASPMSILKVLQNLPDIAAEDVDELEGLIKSGKLPVRIQGEFGGEEARDRHGKAFQIR